jgi:flagellin
MEVRLAKILKLVLVLSILNALHKSRRILKMGLRIQNNIAALNTHRQMQISDANLARSLERLSSGYRINRAADDAAGLSVSMKFRAQIRSLYQASRNASEGNSLLQVAEGGADQISGILSRMKELATQAASANTTAGDRTNINNEVDTLRDEIDRIAASTKYGTTALINGNFGTTGVSQYGSLSSGNEIIGVDVTNAAGTTSYNVAITTGSQTTRTMVIGDGDGNTQTITISINTITEGSTSTLNFSDLGIKVTVTAAYDTTAAAVTANGTDMVTTALGDSTFQVGSENSTDDRISFSLGDMTADGLSINGIDVNSQTGAQDALTDIDSAISTLAERRADVGVTQNRFGFTIANIATSVENITAAESVIRDADLAFETIAFTKNQILLQAGTAMLAQANLAPQSILGVLG